MNNVFQYYLISESLILKLEKIANKKAKIDDYFFTVQNRNLPFSNVSLNKYRNDNFDFFYNSFNFISTIINLPEDDFEEFEKMLTPDLKEHFENLEIYMEGAILNETKFFQMDDVLNDKANLFYLSDMVFNYLLFRKDVNFDYFINGFLNVDLRRLKQSMYDKFENFKKVEIFRGDFSGEFFMNMKKNIENLFYSASVEVEKNKNLKTVISYDRFLEERRKIK